MDRQAWIAVTLCIIGLVAWQFYFSSKYPPVPDKPGAAATASPVPGASASPAPARENAQIVPAGRPAPGDVVADRKEAAPAAAAVPASPDEIIATPQIKLTFTSLGGGISEAEPQGKQHLAENGENIRLNRAGQIPVGALSVQPGQDAREPYTLSRAGNDRITAERTGPDGLKVTKEYTLDYQGDPQQIPAVRLKVTFTNTAAQPYRNPGYYIHAGSAALIHRRDLPTYLSFDWLSDGKYHTDHVTSFEAGHVPLVGIETHAARDTITAPIDKAAWVAVKNQFYATVVTPLNTPADQEPAAREVWARRFDLPLSPQEAAENLPVLHGIDVALGLPALELAPGETKSREFQIYTGPKYYSRLDKLGHEEQEVMDFGKFKIVSITLLALMNTFKSWFGSYAIAIILLTIMVKAVLFPLQNKANKSMKRMSSLSPLMTEIREKYKDDPTRLNQETMKLYKAHGVNPLGGCWPMLIQMPIFFGFLYMLYTAAELRNSSFLWVHDLSQPDTVARLAIPGLGTVPINVLPLLMIGAQFWQMSMTPKTGDPAQQKTLMFMPLLFGFFCYNFAAALALYYTMQTLLTILQLRLTRDTSAPGAAPQAIRVSGDPGPGLGGGGRKGFGKRYPNR